MDGTLPDRNGVSVLASKEQQPDCVVPEEDTLVPQQPQRPAQVTFLFHVLFPVSIGFDFKRDLPPIPRTRQFLPSQHGFSIWGFALHSLPSIPEVKSTKFQKGGFGKTNNYFFFRLKSFGFDGLVCDGC